MAEAPAPAPEKVPLPTQDEEFVFESIDAAPAWIDKGWAGYSNGPALQLPVDLFRDQPYATKVARVGDTVKFMAAKGAKPAHFEVIEGDASLEEGVGTIKPAMVSNASLEDLIKLGNVSPDDLGSDAKAQVAARTPALKRVIDGDDPAPEPQDIAVKAQSA